MPTFGTAYYAADIAEFIDADPDAVLGRLAMSSGDDTLEQKNAWQTQIALLKDALRGHSGHVFMEFTVPRLGDRIDAVVLSGDVIVPIEFKVGASRFNTADVNQAWDYALDLKNFHLASRAAQIIPVLVATGAQLKANRVSEPYADLVYSPLLTNGDDLSAMMDSVLARATTARLDPAAWVASPYSPTPTIIEAARVLYASHSVQALACNEAGENLACTARAVDELVDAARQDGRKKVIFVTGVPGAGKTLVGLDTATRRHDQSSDTHAVFLSGNGPLVAVLTEALTRDEVRRRRASGIPAKKGEVRQSIKAFIHLIHHFRDAGIRATTPPSEHVVIFDEAQRAWDCAMTSDFMRRKKGLPGFEESEPELLLSYMDRHRDWAVVVCLVGGGQEINRGEAGISGWIDAVRTRFTDWDVHISPELHDSEYAAGKALERLGSDVTVVNDRRLHLSVSMRSFRAEHVSRFVKALLDSEEARARDVLRNLIGKYPIALTQDLETARRWLRAHGRGSERAGLVATSGAMRLKPHAIDVRAPINPIHWFLNEPDDIRASSFLEDAATEFQVQGLELDWVCVNWDADLRKTSTGWTHHLFAGTKWKALQNEARIRYLINAYRVLLTRARQGMVIFVPPGHPGDSTRLPDFYAPTYDYLRALGIPAI
ncbi:DUF2075 domain-containing protein [Lysobacter sp. HA35]